MTTIASRSAVMRVSLARPVRQVRAHGCHITTQRLVVEQPVVIPDVPELIEPFQRIVEELHELQERQRSSLQELQELATEIAVCVAERVVRTSVDRGLFAIDALVQEVVDTLRPEDTLLIQLHPDDLAMVSHTLKQHGIQGASVRFKGNPDIQRGECRAESSHMCLTSSIPAQLAQIRSKLLQNLQNAQIERRQTADTAPLLQRFPDRRASG